MIELLHLAISLAIYRIYIIILSIMLPLLYICMSLNICSFLLKIRIIGINLKQKNHQVPSVKLHVSTGKIECLTICIIGLLHSRESSMELLILQTILKELEHVLAMVNHIFYWNLMSEIDAQLLIWIQVAQVQPLLHFNFVIIY